MVKQSLLGLFSESSSLAQPSIGELFGTVCQGCDLGLSDLVRLAGGALLGRQEGLRQLLGARVKRITVKPFMDVHTMLEERLVQCCVRVCPVNVFDAVPQAAPTIARQADCQTCLL